MTKYGHSLNLSLFYQTVSKAKADLKLNWPNLTPAINIFFESYGYTVRDKRRCKKSSILLMFNYQVITMWVNDYYYEA